MDYNDFEPKNSKSPLKKAKVLPHGIRWWTAEDKILPGAVMAQVSTIIQADRGRIDSYNTYAKLYGTYTPTFWNGYQLSSNGRPAAPMRDRLSYNIVQSAIDTLVSRITQDKPKPMFLTSGGDARLQRKAKKLDKFCYGAFYTGGVYELAEQIFKDSCVFGEGIIHCYAAHGKICYERVLPYEILVDYLESHYGPQSTKSLFRIKNIDRTELANLYPDMADEIAKMGNTSSYISSSQRSVGDTVTVVEAWRLPTGEEVGRHSIVTDSCVLLDEEYLDDHFPFSIIRYSPRLYGFYSQSLAEQLIPLQVEINRTLISIQRSLYLGGTHKIFVKAGSKVIKSHIDNQIGTIMEYAGDTPPSYVTPQLVQPEIYNHLESMIQKGYQISGVSQLSAVNEKPAGLNSGRALRTFANNQDLRFHTVQEAYQRFFIDLAKVSVSVARRYYEEEGDFTVKVPGKKFIEEIDWREVNLNDDQYQLQIYPVSKLPNDPEGRLETIQDMLGAGLISPDAGRRLLDFPDLEAEENLFTATSEYLHKIFSEMIEEGKYTPPEPFDNLREAEKLALEYYSMGKLNNLDEDKLELLRRFLRQVAMLTEPPPPDPMMMDPGMAPPVDPGVAPPIDPSMAPPMPPPPIEGMPV